MMDYDRTYTWKEYFRAFRSALREVGFPLLCGVLLIGGFVWVAVRGCSESSVHNAEREQQRLSEFKRSISAIHYVSHEIAALRYEVSKLRSVGSQFLEGQSPDFKDGHFEYENGHQDSCKNQVDIDQRPIDFIHSSAPLSNGCSCVEDHLREQGEGDQQ